MNRRIASSSSSKFVVAAVVVVLGFVLCISLLRTRDLEGQLQRLKIIIEALPYEKTDEELRFRRKLLSNDEPFIFIGGVPRSGTTLMRAMLDAHPKIRCGGETMIIPMFLHWQAGWRTSDWLNGSHITNQVLDDAVSAFLSEIIVKHGRLAERLCNKDPYTAMWVPTLRRLFPNGRYVLMLRDARAIVHSMIDRKVPVAGYNVSNPEQMFRKWNQEISKMLFQCINAPGLCIQVYYERLVLKPEEEMSRILDFLDIPFDESVLHHHQLIGQEVDLNDQEFSASQVKNALNTAALTSWFDCFSSETLEQIDELAPMLSALGYDTSSTTPTYERFAAEELQLAPVAFSDLFARRPKT